jgi:hypothetical protein
MSRPASSAMAGSRLIRVLNALAVSRRRARNSSVNGSTGLSTPSVSVMPSSGQVTRLSAKGPAMISPMVPATGIETASPLSPLTRSPTRCVSRM